MPTTRFDSDQMPEDQETFVEELELPDWLAELMPTEEGPATAPVEAAPVQSVHPLSGGQETMPGGDAANEPSSTPSLIGEEDFPAWLKALSDKGEDKPFAAAGDDAAPAPTGAHLPTWAQSAPPAVPAVARAIAAPAEAPPVWSTRRSRSQAETVEEESAESTASELGMETPGRNNHQAPERGAATSSSSKRYKLVVLVVLLILAVAMAAVLMGWIPAGWR